MQLDNIKIGQRLNYGFLIIIILTAIISGLAATNISKLSNNINSLYNQPFAVSTAILRINGNIGHINQVIKDILLITMPEDMDGLEKDISRLIALIEKDFVTAKGSSESDNDLLNKTKKEFDEWIALQKTLLVICVKDKATLPGMKVKAIATLNYKN